MATPDLAYAIGLPPEQAIRYFESKGYAIGFKWQDVWADAHARAFTVAGVMKVDVLQDIRASLAKVLRDGGTFAEFKRDIEPILERKGWLGRGLVVDPATGEIHGKRLTPRRLDTIFRTNLQSAYMAGRYASMMENVGDRPFWEYVAVMDNRTRPAHRALHGRIHRYDDPFWKTFYPPNGWRCRCRVRARSQGDVDANDLALSSSDGRLVEIDQVVDRDGNTRPAIAFNDPATGQRMAPDPGFGFNPGEAWMRPLTPASRDSLPVSFPPGVDLPPLPRTGRIGAQTLLPAGETPETYARAFLQEFGADIGKPVVYTDAAGGRLLINEWLFQDGAGNWKADKMGRGPFLQVLASTIRQPDEIWLAWSDATGRSRLLRRYMKGLETEDGDWGLAVFEQGEDGWTGVTVFPAKVGKSQAAREAYINAQRGTFLLYKAQK